MNKQPIYRKPKNVNKYQEKKCSKSQIFGP